MLHFDNDRQEHICGQEDSNVGTNVKTFFLFCSSDVCESCKEILDFDVSYIENLARLVRS